MFMKDVLDGKKMQGKSEENALTQSFEKSPLLMGMTDYPFVLLMASLWIRSGLAWP